ncbi:hypothetical protein AB0M87_06035 [Streptomyces sp. NPDC051320]|uniref:hypothetical protein n=1 Tax=Streptomyces sp. NPDC051320 TaxID=3154644 RepID=UPI00342A7A7F
MPVPPTDPAPASGARGVSRRRAAPQSRPSAVPPPHPSSGSANQVVRWAAFCCVLVPGVRLVHGTGLGDTALTALGLVAVTLVCRLLLRQSERAAARAAAGPAAHRRETQQRTGTGAHRGGRRPY